MKFIPVSICLMTAVIVFVSAGWCSQQQLQSEPSTVAYDAKLIDMNNGICASSTSELMWQIKRSREFDSWQQASEYAENLELGGYTDWRLPTQKELKKLHEIFDWRENGNCKLISSTAFWSGNIAEHGFCGFVETVPQCGSTGYEFIRAPRGKGAVRAVRP